MIEELRHKMLIVILGDVPLDNRDDLRFKKLIPILWQH